MQISDMGEGVGYLLQPPTNVTLKLSSRDNNYVFGDVPFIRGNMRGI